MGVQNSSLNRIEATKGASLLPQHIKLLHPRALEKVMETEGMHRGM